MDITEHRQLNLSKILNRPMRIISSEEALKDVTPIQWSENILSGKMKVVICQSNE